MAFLVLGPTAGSEYTTAWLLEKSLSVDNLFVFAVIFAYFKASRAYRRRVLFLGIGLAVILSFIGVKLVLQASHELISLAEIPIYLSLSFIVVVLAASDPPQPAPPAHVRRGPPRRRPRGGRLWATP